MVVKFPFTNFNQFRHASTIFINSRQTPFAYQWRDCRHTFSRHVIGILIDFRLFPILCSMAEQTKKMFYLHTWSRNKSSCDTSNVFWNFSELSTDEHWEEMKKKKSKTKNTNRKVLLIFFPPICYIEFSPSLSFPSSSVDANNKQSKSIGRVMVQILFSYFPRVSFQGLRLDMRRKTKRKFFIFEKRWKKLIKLPWQKSLYSRHVRETFPSISIFRRFH